MGNWFKKSVVDIVTLSEDIISVVTDPNIGPIYLAQTIGQGVIEGTIEGAKQQAALVAAAVVPDACAGLMLVELTLKLLIGDDDDDAVDGTGKSGMFRDSSLCFPPPPSHHPPPPHPPAHCWASHLPIIFTPGPFLAFAVSQDAEDHDASIGLRTAILDEGAKCNQDVEKSGASGDIPVLKSEPWKTIKGVMNKQAVKYAMSMMTPKVHYFVEFGAEIGLADLGAPAAKTATKWTLISFATPCSFKYCTQSDVESSARGCTEVAGALSIPKFGEVTTGQLGGGLKPLFLWSEDAVGKRAILKCMARDRKDLDLKAVTIKRAEEGKGVEVTFNIKGNALTPTEDDKTFFVDPTKLMRDQADKIYPPAVEGAPAVDTHHC